VSDAAVAVAPPAPQAAPRLVRVFFRGDWGGRRHGLLASDPRVRTLRKVLVTYPEVRHILPDRVSLEPDTDRRVLDAVARFLDRQHWLVKSVAIE
jgi:hypothetical protein